MFPSRLTACNKCLRGTLPPEAACATQNAVAAAPAQLLLCCCCYICCVAALPLLLLLGLLVLLEHGVQLSEDLMHGGPAGQGRAGTGRAGQGRARQGQAANTVSGVWTSTTVPGSRVMHFTIGMCVKVDCMTLCEAAFCIAPLQDLQDRQLTICAACLCMLLQKRGTIHPFPPFTCPPGLPPSRPPPSAAGGPAAGQPPGGPATWGANPPAPPEMDRSRRSRCSSSGGGGEVSCSSSASSSPGIIGTQGVQGPQMRILADHITR